MLFLGLIVVVGVLVNTLVRNAMEQTIGFQIPAQTNKLAIVTGANSGLGLEAALQLAGAGADVVMACRNMKSCNDVVSSTTGDLKLRLKCMKLDLASFDSIHSFANKFNAAYINSEQSGGPTRRLDLLVNNAGIMFAPLTFTEQGLESQIGSNYVGHFLLTGLLLPSMSKKARIINHSSAAALLAHPLWPEMTDFKSGGSGWLGQGYNSALEYGHSKRAMLYFTWELNARLKAAGSRIQAVAVQPGYTATNLQTNKFPLWETLNKHVAMSPSQGVQSLLLGATSSRADVLNSTHPVVLGPSLLLLGGPAVQSGEFYTLFESKERRERRQLSLWQQSVQTTHIMGDLILR